MKKIMVDDVRGDAPIHYENNSSDKWRKQVLLFDEDHPKGVMISFEQLFKIMVRNPGMKHEYLRSGVIVWMIDRPDNSRRKGQIFHFNLTCGWIYDGKKSIELEQLPALMVN